MILVDTNILLYAYDKVSTWHSAASTWLLEAFENEAVLRFAEVTLLGFLRITTDSRLVKMARPIEEVASIVDGWLDRENVGLLEPTYRHWLLLRELLVDSRSTGGRVTDAHLAALAIEHGATLCTNDRDFRRFPSLSVRFPLLDPA